MLADSVAMFCLAVRRRFLSFVAAPALTVGAALAACSLNPQPLPREATGRSADAGSHADAALAVPRAPGGNDFDPAGGDAAVSRDATGDVSTDAPSDAPGDAPDEGG